MSNPRDQGGTRSNRGAALKQAQTRCAAQCRRFRRSIVALIRGWVRSGIVANVNQVAVELNRRGVPQFEGNKGWQRKVVVGILRQEAPNLLAKLDRPRRRYLTVPELARRLGVNNKQIYYAVSRGTLGCRRFGRKIVFHPDVVERAASALREDHAKTDVMGASMYKTLVSTVPRPPPLPAFEPQGPAHEDFNALTAKGKSCANMGVYKSSDFNGIHSNLVDYTDL